MITLLILAWLEDIDDGLLAWAMFLDAAIVGIVAIDIYAVAKLAAS